MLFEDKENRIYVKDSEDDFIVSPGELDDTDKFKELSGRKKGKEWTFEKSNKNAVKYISKLLDVDLESKFSLEKRLKNLENNLTSKETPQKEHEKKIVWTNPDQDKFVIDYTEKSFVFFAPKDFTDSIEEFNSKLCLKSWYNTSTSGKKREGFCFPKSSQQAIDFINKIMNEDNDGMSVDISDLLGLAKKITKKVKAEPEASAVPIEGVPKLQTPMRIFYNLTNAVSEGNYSKMGSCFYDLIKKMEQKCRNFKEEKFEDGSICIYGSIKEVESEFSNIKGNENEESYIKNEFVYGPNKICLIGFTYNTDADIEIKKVTDNKIVVSGSSHDVDEVVKTYTNEDQDDVYLIKSSLSTEGKKIVLLEKE